MRSRRRSLHGRRSAGYAQTAPSREDARAIEVGKEIYKVKANCQFCHKWDGSGDQGYGGNASSLRKTFLTPEQFADVIKCGRPGTGMPYHDQFAYTDKRCFDMTREDIGKDMPPIGEFASEARDRCRGQISLRQGGRTWRINLRGLRRLLGHRDPAVRAHEEMKQK